MRLSSKPLYERDREIEEKGLNDATWLLNDRVRGEVAAKLAWQRLDTVVNGKKTFPEEPIRVPYKCNLTREQHFQRLIHEHSIELWPEHNQSDEDNLVRFLTLQACDLYSRRRNSFHAIAGFVRLNYGLTISEAYDLYITLRPTSVSARQSDPASWSDAKTKLLESVRKHFCDAIKIEPQERNDLRLKPHDNPGLLREVAKECLRRLALRLSEDIKDILDIDRINKERLEGVLSREDNKAELVRMHIAIGRLEEFVGIFQTSPIGRPLKVPQLIIPEFFDNQRCNGLSEEKAQFASGKLSRPSRLNLTFQTSMW